MRNADGQNGETSAFQNDLHVLKRHARIELSEARLDRDLPKAGDTDETGEIRGADELAYVWEPLTRVGTQNS
ncbi:hypothetical protein JL39_07950 [Rhizobium sp. YS-1r]|nr:hypothetical protein JL39_07950 [Rhizobium sp. YS-1r]